MKKQVKYIGIMKTFKRNKKMAKAEQPRYNKSFKNREKMSGKYVIVQVY